MNILSFEQIKTINKNRKEEILYLELPLKQGYSYQYILDFDNKLEDIQINHKLFKELKEEERILILSILGKINMDLKIKIIDDINRYLFLEMSKFSKTEKVTHLIYLLLFIVLFKFMKYSCKMLLIKSDHEIRRLVNF